MTCPVSGDHPEPVNGPVCDRCHNDVAANLSFLASNIGVVPLEEPHTLGGGRTPPASKPPLSIVALSFTAQGGLIALLTEWVQVLTEHDRANPPDYHLAVTPRTLAQLRLLKQHTDWLLTHNDLAAPFVTEIGTATHDLVRLLDPDRTWLPLPGRWVCPVIDPDGDGQPCGGLLRQHKGKWLVKCSRCHSLWEGDTELERLGRMLGCELDITVAQAAVLASVSERTIYLWVKAGTLPSTTVNGRQMIDRRDLALTLAVRDGS